jgi:hypothetical protein
MKMIFATGLALGVLAMGAPAGAASILFSGSRMNVDAPGAPAARCGARATTSVRHDPPTATSTGLSNFGAFTPTLSHCIQLPLAMSGPTPFDLGEFVFDFETGDSLFGTYSGSLSPIAPRLFSVAQTHIVTGGSGFFAGATGSFDSSGTLSFLTGAPVVSQTFAGVLNVAAVPEPATWAMMIGGFALVGGAMRTRRRKDKAAVAHA